MAVVDDARRARAAQRRSRAGDRAWPGCALLDREVAARADGSDEEKAAVAAQLDALKRWCAACLHDPAYRLVGRSSGFPETLDYCNLVQVQRPRPICREAMLGPDARLRRRDGFTLTDAPLDAARGAERDPLLRAVPRARQGFVLEGAARQGRARSRRTRSAFRCPAARSTRRSPRCTCCARAATPSARWPSSSSTTRCVPGTGHRICNDCMKACIYQKQEPVNIPQIETGVLTDVLQHAVGRRDLRPAHALESAERAPPVCAARTTDATCSSSASGPAGYTLAHYLLNEGFGVVAIDGLKIEPLPRGAGPATAAALPQPIARLGRHLSAARRARARGLRRRVRVRHHRPLGQELPHAPAPDAGAPRQACASTAACASAARCRSRTRGRTGSITSPSPPAPAGRPSST